MAAGRPSSFRPEYCEQANKLCKLGAIDAEMAEFFGVSEVTLNAWKRAHPEFLNALKAGKLLADAEVGQKLYERALGYSHPEVHVSNFQGLITLTDLTKHYPPDSTAAIFWLKNRQPGKWRDLKAVELANADGKPFSLTLNNSDAGL